MNNHERQHERRGDDVRREPELEQPVQVDERVHAAQSGGRLDHFEQTLALVEYVRYESAFTFIFSPRSGTEAATLSGQVPDEVKHERLERLVELVQRVAAERNAERIGRIEEVLVEGPSRTDPSLRRGRTRRNTTVNFTGSAHVGELAEVLIDGATSTTLRGRAAELVAA